MDDYLKTGRISPPETLDILHKRPTAAQPLRKEELYLHGYGRHFGEKLTYSTGLAYGTGLAVGGSYGLALGVSKGGATRKLFLNSVLNSCSTHGPGLANQCGVITMFYVGFNNLVAWIRGEDDVINAATSGFLAGGLYKVTQSWMAAGRYAAASTVAFTGVDLALRYRWI
uniref:Mitochondrial import inner membrane translocase subunit TIM23 n=1 Tax=Chromera velia CCMP2878 TaxID=1169474 RepID=A0A0G4I2L1_9ALVE|mmetsp:Transcript_18100/g.36715  ORF Transcript_18100/g.36715 Transcript_18100/m.36715 type:complete len:170 (-) Transcript_18100:381-890(-)|eukprot:Cvel_10444.t1-p1 / transcript=Cvel_10444.t1 / gene=Cvel_10444 / organism=Chromera_velia_CCMP2878 / gene_product=Mitochondrial import inner membrane translocase, putative / transcript_product=Mitochondrial import inner membrane translocase, putative / location=Cvel_scaffold629:17402-19827(-) / protein_length=169 / sequence_SO=supercontig / SO=protein_coding / is_pseudo=false